MAAAVHFGPKTSQKVDDALRSGRISIVLPGAPETPPSPWRSERLARRSTNEWSPSNSGVSLRLGGEVCFAWVGAAESADLREVPGGHGGAAFASQRSASFQLSGSRGRRCP